MTEARDKEDQCWHDAEGLKSSTAKKLEEESEKRAEAATCKAVGGAGAEGPGSVDEEPDKKENPVSIPVPKVTGAELRKRREEEQVEFAKKSEEAKKKQGRTAEDMDDGAKRRGAEKG